MSFYIYKHTISGSNAPFYIGMAKKTKGYKRANVFDVKKRNNIWADIYNKSGKNIIIEILYENLNFEKACEIECLLIKKYGKLYNKTGCLANISDGGKLSHRPPFKVAQYDFKGNLIRCWNSVIEASFVCNVCDKAIYSAIGDYGNRSSAGFIWRRIENGERPCKTIPSCEHFRYVYQFDRIGNLIAEWDSLLLASTTLSIDRASINNAILGYRKSAGGYLWSYEKIINSGQKIIQYDLNMNKIKEYSRLSEIVDELNLSSNTAIRNCFSGKQKQAYGFKWFIIK